MNVITHYLLIHLLMIYNQQSFWDAKGSKKILLCQGFITIVFFRGYSYRWFRMTVIILLLKVREMQGRWWLSRREYHYCNLFLFWVKILSSLCLRRSTSNGNYKVVGLFYIQRKNAMINLSFFKNQETWKLKKFCLKVF